jgi:cysteine desulfurase family protein (TIGR01976 family)
MTFDILTICNSLRLELAPNCKPSAMTSTPTFDDLATIRARFSALRQEQNGRPVVFFDGPAGSQVPDSVVSAFGEYLTTMNANLGGVFVTSRRSDAALDEAHRALADFLGANDPDCVVFGANMTTLTFALSRALARTWRTGDEIIVTRLDHDANVSPWVLAALDANVTVQHVEVRRSDCTLDLDDLRRKLSPRTRLVAVGAASNAVGTVNPVADVVSLAHSVGARVFVDAVHYAPHRRTNVADWGCDFCVCSGYKFFGPHVGVLWGRRELLESMMAYKVRPAPNDLPGRWMTGTQNHEGIYALRAAVDYLVDLGRCCQAAASRPSAAHDVAADVSRSAALDVAFDAIAAYERELSRHLLTGLAALPDVKVYGITDLARLDERVPTVSITHRRLPPRAVAERLAEAGIFVWHGNFYALPWTEAFDLEPAGVVRIGLLHYNTHDEIDRLLACLATI